MKITIDILDDDAARVAPCKNANGHNHTECVRQFVELQLHGATFKVESEASQKEFQDQYKRPELTVTAE